MKKRTIDARRLKAGERLIQKGISKYEAKRLNLLKTEKNGNPSPIHVEENNEIDSESIASGIV